MLQTLEIFLAHEKRVNLLVLQVSNLVLARGQYRNNLIANLSALRPFFYEKLADFYQIFGVSNESGTYNNQESYDLDPKLTLTCIVLLRKVPIL